MAIVTNGGYHSPEIASVAQNIASMFGPPSASDLAGYSTARVNNQKAATAAQLAQMATDKTTFDQQIFDRLNIAGGNYNPTQSYYAQDQNNSTAIRGQDVVAATSRANNLLDNQSKIAIAFGGPADPTHSSLGLSPDLADHFGMPEIEARAGVPKPMSMTEWQANHGQRLYDEGGLTDTDLIDIIRGDNTPVKVIGPDGKQVYVTPGEAVRTGAQPAPSDPLVSVGAGEKAWETESAKLFAQKYDAMQTQAQAAQEMLGLFGIAEEALDSGVHTGIGGEQLLDLQRLGSVLGVGNADQIAGGELLRAIQNRMALIMRSPESGMGMPGAVSDRDLTFLKDAQIGLDRSPEGNKKMIQYFAALERRKIEAAELADAYIQENGRMDAGFNVLLREYANENPLFSEALSPSVSSMAPSAPPTGAVEALRADPSRAAEFDAKYGEGAAAAVLGVAQ